MFTKNELRKLHRLCDAVQLMDFASSKKYNGTVTEKNLENSVKDDTVMFPGSKLRRVAIKYGFLGNEKLAKKIAADPEWQAIIKKYKDPLWSAPSTIDEIVKKYMLTDSIHDRLGEGKCAPTGHVGLVSSAEYVSELLKNIQKNTSDPLYEKKLAIAKRKYDGIKAMIEHERQEIDAFDRYWQSHKKEMMTNILAAEKVLRWHTWQ